MWPSRPGPHIPTSRSCCPGATSAEGIARGDGSTFYAGDLFAGDIFRGNVQSGTAELFIDAPDDGRMAVGMAFDRRHRLLFVAGGGDGTGLRVRHGTPARSVADYEFSAQPTFINDVAVTRDGAWFTDSARATPLLRPDRPR